MRKTKKKDSIFVVCGSKPTLGSKPVLGGSPLKKIITFINSRLFTISLLIILQIGIVFLLAHYLTKFLLPIIIVLNILLVILILNRDSNADFKLAWIIPVLLFPFSGALFYLLLGQPHLLIKNNEKLKNAIDSGSGYLKFKTSEAIKTNNRAAREIEYISKTANTGVFDCTKTQFFHPGIKFFEILLAELEKAQKFIFMEYFIIKEGIAFEKVYEILLRKVKQGVEVRIMYDDIGSITKLPSGFAAKLRGQGIKVAVFNPFKPSMDRFLNYRDHRKYAIIDGKIAFTGGINLSDEYMGFIERLGFWEDSAIMLEGDAVNKMTISLLQLWSFATGEIQDYPHYLTDFKAENDGYVIPFSDEPPTGEFVSENAYLNLIESAQKYVYICTPYLILDDLMSNSLIRAAKSGIDVKIITPAIPDKKLVFLMTRSNYKSLINAGVEIYEFTPGFMHTKAVVSDDLTAIVGTANFDYRSFYLHFENGVWMYKSKAVLQVRDMFLKNLKKSQRITSQFFEKISLWKRLLSSLLKVFAPMM